MHLAMADAILADQRLPESVRAVLHDHLPAFRLGNIAPDAQTVSGQRREATHFFTVPMVDRRPAHETMVECHPELGRAAELEPERAAFLTGYVCHLALDQLWIGQIFEPIFGERAEWASFRERLFLHNILRTWLDQEDLPLLLAGVGPSLAAAQPTRWLPFLADEHLAGWRDLVSGQLQPGATAQTVEIFARRMNRDPQELAALLDSPEELDRQVFSRLPREELAGFRVAGLTRSLELAAEYWGI
jgi:hypothetical protein